MLHNKLPRIIKQLHTKRQKELGKTIEEVSGCEPGMGRQVAQLHDSYMMMMMYNTVRFKISKQPCIYKYFLSVFL
jgi:hypothetical protein